MHLVKNTIAASWNQFFQWSHHQCSCSNQKSDLTKIFEATAHQPILLLTTKMFSSSTRNVHLCNEEFPTCSFSYWSLLYWCFCIAKNQVSDHFQYCSMEFLSKKHATGMIRPNSLLCWCVMARHTLSHDLACLWCYGYSCLRGPSWSVHRVRLVQWMLILMILLSH